MPQAGKPGGPLSRASFCGDGTRGGRRWGDRSRRGNSRCCTVDRARNGATEAGRGSRCHRTVKHAAAAGRRARGHAVRQVSQRQRADKKHARTHRREARQKVGAAGGTKQTARTSWIENSTPLLRSSSFTRFRMKAGFFAYATYDLTNLATLKNWPVGLALLPDEKCTLYCRLVPSGTPLMLPLE